MADILEPLLGSAPLGPFGKPGGDRGERWTNAPVFSRLSPADQAIVNAVCMGERQRAMVLHDGTLYLFEHDPGVRTIAGRRYGYTARRLLLPVSTGKTRPDARAVPLQSTKRRVQER